MKLEEILKMAEVAIQREEYSRVVPLATQLINAGDPWDLSGYLFRGIAFEFGDDKLAIDLSKAISDYRHLSYIAPDGISFQYLARALMSQGKENYPTAFAYLKEAKKLRQTPEIDLGFADFYSKKEDPDFVEARKYYLRAALQGRFMGFFGYSRMSRLLGQPFRAIFMSFARVILGPVLAVILGSDARRRF